MRSLLPEINFDAKEDSSNALEPLQSFGSKSTNIESLWKEKNPATTIQITVLTGQRKTRLWESIESLTATLISLRRR